jgi:hypothetical protein
MNRGASMGRRDVAVRVRLPAGPPSAQPGWRAGAERILRLLEMQGCEGNGTRRAV